MTFDIENFPHPFHLRVNGVSQVLFHMLKLFFQLHTQGMQLVIDNLDGSPTTARVRNPAVASAPFPSRRPLFDAIVLLVHVSLFPRHACVVVIRFS